jgi:hypothetical protein
VLVERIYAMAARWRSSMRFRRSKVSEGDAQLSRLLSRLGLIQRTSAKQIHDSVDDARERLWR